MSIAWSLYDRIINLSDVFANHFNNLLALDFQEETQQGAGQNANKWQWRQVEQGRRTRRADPQASQARCESLAQTLKRTPSLRQGISGVTLKSKFNPLPLPQVEQP